MSPLLQAGIGGKPEGAVSAFVLIPKVPLQGQCLKAPVGIEGKVESNFSWGVITHLLFGLGSPTSTSSIGTYTSSIVLDFFYCTIPTLKLLTLR